MKYKKVSPRKQSVSLSTDWVVTNARGQSLAVMIACKVSRGQMNLYVIERVRVSTNELVLNPCWDTTLGLDRRPSPDRFAHESGRFCRDGVRSRCIGSTVCTCSSP